MVMETIQVRLSHGLIEKMDDLVQTGVYSSRSDVLRDAVRRLVLDKLVGILPDKGDSVQKVRMMRTKLSNKKLDLNEINKLVE